MCGGDRDKTVMLLISECEKLVQSGYKKKHDWVASIIHWELPALFRFERSKKSYDRRFTSVLENEGTKIFWDFDIHTNRVIEAKKLDIVVVDKQNSNASIIDIAVPGDFRVKDKAGKDSEVPNLALKTNKMWNVKTR